MTAADDDATVAGSKRRRTGTPRSRGGCFTCRRRKVKCDEGVPQCQRCIKMGVSCEGYKPIPTERPLRRPLPNIESKAKLVQVQPTNVFMDETEIENRYLRHFHKATSSGLYNTTDFSLWNRLVMQTCHHEPFVRHCVIAIGALNKSLQASYTWREDASEYSTDLEAARLHREFAFMQYGKALKLMRGVLDNTANPRQALIACLLVVCFETFLGDRLLALAHAETGLRILRQWENKNFSWSSKKLMSTASPAPEIVEDEIVEAFANLDVKISTVSDWRPDEIHILRLGEDSDAIENMPLCFSDLREARQYWNIVIRQICHFLATTWSKTQSMSLSRDFTNDAPTVRHVMTGVNIFSTPHTVTDDLREAQRPHALEVSNWSKAFNKVFVDVRKAECIDLSKYITTCSLRIQCIAASVLIAGVLFTEEIMYDRFLPQFREMLELIDIIVSKRQQQPDYSFWNGGFLLDLGVVPCLFVVTLRCRDPHLRRHALKLLRGWQLEACWDPRLIRELGQFMMEVEEEGMVDGQIPEKSRAAFSRIAQDPEKRVALLQCVLKCGGPNGEMVWREKHVTW